MRAVEIIDQALAAHGHETVLGAGVLSDTLLDVMFAVSGDTRMEAVVREKLVETMYLDHIEGDTFRDTLLDLRTALAPAHV